SPIISLAKLFTWLFVAFGRAAAPSMLSAMFTSSNRATMLASDNVAGLEGAAAAAPAPVSVGAGVAAAEVVSVADAFSFPLHAPSATHAISRSDRSVYRRRTSCIRPPDGVETKDGKFTRLSARKTRTACGTRRDVDGVTRGGARSHGATSNPANNAATRGMSDRRDRSSTAA